VLIAYDYTRRSGCAPRHADAQFGTGIAYDFSRPSCRTKAEEHLQRTVPDQKRVDGDEGGDHQLGVGAREGRRPPLSPREHTEVGEQVVG
jgi:hypothetical protein